ncbi:3-oxoacyl-ACP synthase III family protein [Actinokineospora sp. 24-640]
MVKPTTAVITGLGGCVPDTLVKNEAVAARLGVDADWIRERTGIEQRFVTGADEATSDLAVRAGKAALDSCGATGADFLILATTTPDHQVPGTAPAVASRLGMAGAPAFDLNAACSGFLYALAVGAGMLATGQYRTGLVIGADTFTTFVDDDDQITAPIFGDGAGAAVIRAGGVDEPGAITASTLGSDGDLTPLMIVTAGGSRQRVAEAPGDNHFTMRGKIVFKNAVRRMSEASARVMADMGWSVDDVDWLVGHQANRRILDATADALGIPGDKAVVNIERVANTSAASIPLALCDAASEGAFTPGDRVVLTAFGGGATWAALALTWPDLPPIAAASR